MISGCEVAQQAPLNLEQAESEQGGGGYSSNCGNQNIDCTFDEGDSWSEELVVEGTLKVGLDNFSTFYVSGSDGVDEGWIVMKPEELQIYPGWRGVDIKSNKIDIRSSTGDLNFNLQDLPVENASHEYYLCVHSVDFHVFLSITPCR